jgi:hypothetical protein
MTPELVEGIIAKARALLGALQRSADTRCARRAPAALR